jgi:hypothetical protein
LRYGALVAHLSTRISNSSTINGIICPIGVLLALTPQAATGWYDPETGLIRRVREVGVKPFIVKMT